MKKHIRLFLTVILISAIILPVGIFNYTIPVNAQEEIITMAEHDILIDPNGEIKTIEQAQKILRTREDRGSDDNVTVWIKGGTYPQPLSFTSYDRQNVTYRNVPGEEAIISGAKEITGWQKDTVNGVDCWSVTVNGYFTSLYHPTEQISRPRYPAEGYFTVDSVNGAKKIPTPEENKHYNDTFLSFFAKSGEIKHPLYNVTDINLRILHFWKDDLSNLTSYDNSTRELVFDIPTTFTVNPGDRYYLENVFEELKLPGQWYLDRQNQKLYYIPFDGEDITKTVLYSTTDERMITVDGAENITFQGITVKNTAWSIPMPSFLGIFGKEGPQGAYSLNPCVSISNSRGILFDKCKFNNIGSTAIKFEVNVQDSGVTNCEFTYIGGNVIMIFGDRSLLHDNPRFIKNITVHKNLIAHFGRRFFQGAGVILYYGQNVEISNNEIYDGYNAGVSSGMSWGYEEYRTDYVTIKNNLIYDLGHGMLEDWGGIYSLGYQPNSIITGNIVYNIINNPQGNWGTFGIYLDEGSTGMKVEKNLVYNCGTTTFYQNYGKDNIVRNNIFAFGRWGQTFIYKKEDHNSLNLERNIIVSDNQLMYRSVHKDQFRDDGNLYYNYYNPETVMSSEVDYNRGFAYMQDLGYYKNGIIADPLFKDALNFDFTLDPNSPAVKELGFEIWDYAEAGRKNIEEDSPVTFIVNSNTEQSAAKESTSEFEAETIFESTSDSANNPETDGKRNYLKWILAAGGVLLAGAGAFIFTKKIFKRK